MMKLEIKMMEGCNDLFPKKAHEEDACYDIRSREYLTIPCGSYATIHTGVFMNVPKGFEVVFRGRSGLAAKEGILAHVGTIDAGYKGECGVILYNLNGEDFDVRRGDRIGQFLLKRLEDYSVCLVDEFSNNEDRGGGFGSTGVK